MSTDRRDFLKFLLGGTVAGVASSPLQTLIEAAIFESAKRVHAQTIVLNPERFYFNISFPGAPPRWNFDLFLDPYSANGNNFIRNGSVACAFENSGSRYTEAVYKTYKVPGYNIHAPWIWGQHMPTSGGTWMPIHKLMEHMLVIQGVNTEAPGHEESRLRMEQANGYTVAGFLSDNIKSPFNAVDLNSAYSFSSKGGQGATNVGLGSGNLVNTLMNKFNSSDLTINKSLDDDLKVAYQHALDNLNYDAGVRMPASVNIKKTHEGALDLINSSIGNLSQIWNEKFNRYNNLVSQSFTDRERFKGFMDKPVGIANVSNREETYQYNRSAITYNADLRDLAFNGMNARIPSLFAVAEFLAENKLSSSLQGRVNNMTAKIATSAGGNAGNRGITHDQHNVGVMITTMTNALMYRAISSCLYEFIQNRKTSGKGYRFDDTVIRLSGDFNRSPRKDGSGSDHGFQGQVNSIFSGKIKSPQIIGRIYKDASTFGLVGANYSGSWGVGSTVDIEAGPVTLTPGHVLSTVSSLLGIPSPAFNNASLIKVVNGEAQLIKPDLKLKVVG